jgi:ABC-2 type transport system ATP-binding protein
LQNLQITLLPGYHVANTVIEAQNLVKHYGSLRALDDVSFTVDEGEIFAFLGPNGAGKTTAIEVLQCLRPLTSGKARVLGYDVSDPDQTKNIKLKIGVLPQDFSTLDRLTVRENLAMFAAMYPHFRDPDELIRLLEIEDKAKVTFDKLSGGLKQRVGIAAALVNDPQVVFLDEPTTGLDPKSRREVWKVIQQLKSEGRTVFLTTHYMEEAERLADRVAVIHKGRVVANDRTTTLVEQFGGGRSIVVENVSKERFEALRREFAEIRQVNSDAIIKVAGLKQIGPAIEILERLGLSQHIQIRNPTIENMFLRLIGSNLTEEGELV